MPPGCSANKKNPAAVAILYALPDEARYFSDSWEALTIAGEGDGARPERESRAPSTEVVFACTLCTGVGFSNALNNTTMLLTSGRSIGAVIVVGFAGGLEGKLKPGSVVVAERVSDAVSRQEYRADAALLEAAHAVRSPANSVYGGTVATAGRVLVRVAEKQAFARSTGAIAVDMESAGAAAAATKFGVPWLAVRVITDGVNDDLPLDFNALANPDGSVNRGRIVVDTLLHPWKIPALIRLGKRSSLAARNLATFLQALLPQIRE